MSVRLGRFELPKLPVRDEATATSNYAKFVAEPFEAGYGVTIGNALRRVLLSSVEGGAITNVKITGANHEFQTLPGVVEDVTDIILNLKQVKFKCADHEPRTLSISVNKEGNVTAGDIQEVTGVEVVNRKQIICTLDKKTKFEAELTVRVGRGFATGDENKYPDMPIGVIPIDSIFSPVTRVKYAVENTRVGQRTDYDKLIVEVWTDGRIDPKQALIEASSILRKHIEPFYNYDEALVAFDETAPAQNQENQKMKKLLNMSVNEIELSVRAANCLNNANITTVGQLAQKSEQEMLKYRNFGKKSLNEIKEKLTGLSLSLGMKFEAGLVDITTAEVRPATEGSSSQRRLIQKKEDNSNASPKENRQTRPHAGAPQRAALESGRESDRSRADQNDRRESEGRAPVRREARHQGKDRHAALASHGPRRSPS